MHRERMMAVLALFLASVCAMHAQVPTGRLALGGNINERFHWATPQILDQTHTTWVRGFLPASGFMSGQRSYTSDEGMQALKRAADSGHKILLSFKWDSAGRGGFGRMPAPVSKEEKAAFDFADHILDAAAGKLSALVLINELSIDTLPADLAPAVDGRIPVITFLQRLAEHIDAEHRQAAGGGPLQLFAGGMTRLDKAETRDSPAARAMIQWVNSDAKVAGLDYHIHQPDMATTRSAVEYMHHAVPDKPLIITEMSLIWKWRAHLPDPVDISDAGKTFAKKYDIPPGTTVAQFFNAAFQHPVPEAEWQAFLASQPWFEGHYLANMAALLQDNGVKLATYALTWNPHPGEAPFHTITEHTAPWFLNQLLVPGLAYSPDKGRLPENYELFDDYVKLQK
jgi:hypothetical protein